MFFVAFAASADDYSTEPGLYGWRGYAEACMIVDGRPTRACVPMQTKAVFDTEADCRQAMPLLLDQGMRGWGHSAVVRWYCAEDRSVFNA